MGWFSDLVKEFPAVEVAKQRLLLQEELFKQIEKENRELKEQVRHLSEENAALQAKLKVHESAPKAELEDIEVEILKVLSKPGYREGIPAVVISREVGIPETKAEYYAARMEVSELLGTSYIMDEGSIYYLAHGGREYLVRNDLA